MNENKESDIERLHDLLNESISRLDEAGNTVQNLDLPRRDEALRQIGSSIGSILYSKTFLPEDPREPEEVPLPDPPLTEEEQARVDRLNEEEICAIDDALIANAATRFQKAAMIVASTMSDHAGQDKGIPDIFYMQRLRKLVEDGRLESQGNLEYMRFSEVKLPE